MRPSMYDALAQEHGEIVSLGTEAAKIAIEAVRRGTLLQRQLVELAQQARIDAASDSADSKLPASDIPVIQESPEIHPQAQDSEKGNQGSGAVASGEADTHGKVEPEQAVAEAASEERVAPRNEPEVAPDTYEERFAKTLDLYAETKLTTAAMARDLGITRFAVLAHIRTARENGDKRAAKGDVARDIGVPMGERDGAIKAAPMPPWKPFGSILGLDLKECRATYDDQTTQLVRWELRLVHLLNDGAPASLDQIMKHCSFASGKAFKRDLEKLNPRLKEIGVQVVELIANHFQLQLIAEA